MIRYLAWLPWLVPALHAAGALACWCWPSRAWTALRAATLAALAVALAFAVSRLWTAAPAASPAAVVLPLIAFLGWVIGDYSRRYLAGEPGTPRYAVALCATLASVGVVVVSDHLAVIVAAWTASSFSLHHLLTFYRLRRPAIIVAHKKFIASRLADLCLAGACLLLWQHWGTLDVSQLGTLARAAPLPGAAVAATALIAIGVVLKTAQLPVHGWLIQVMEAPTPVSALLHAGVINLGGYVCIRLATLLGSAPLASAVLVLAGGLTAAIAGLVTMTRVSVKVRLAWSTCAQMGFMLLECGLGLFDLALLHLVAHSLYKAHAFLSSGEALRDARLRELLTPSRTGEPRRLGLRPLFALPVAWAATAGSARAWHAVVGTPELSWIAIGLLAIGLATSLWYATAGVASALRRIGGLLLAVQVYLLWHSLIGHWIAAGDNATPPLLGAFAIACIAALYVAQWLVIARPGHPLARRLYPWAYAGFYLDEWFTRLTFQLWPVRVPESAPRGAA